MHSAYLVTRLLEWIDNRFHPPGWVCGAVVVVAVAVAVMAAVEKAAKERSGRPPTRDPGGEPPCDRQ